MSRDPDTIRPRSASAVAVAQLDLRRAAHRPGGALATLLARRDVTGGVRDQIGASWQRSVAVGLQPDSMEVPFDPDVDDDGLLLRAARPVLEQLALDLASAPVAAILATADGQVVDRRVPDASLGTRLDRIMLAPGFVYAEGRIGTNGIGTALTQRRPAAVEGHEHFADALTGMACAGAPISDLRSGRVLGVIDLTSLVRDGSALMLPLATRAARDIEQRLLDDAGIREQLILRRFLQERRRAKGPVVFITPRAMIANAAADRLIAPDDETLLRDWVMRRQTAGHRDESSVVLTSGAAVTVRAEPLLDGGSPVGTMLRLAPIADPAVDRAGAGGRQRFGWDSLTATERSVVELVARGMTNREAAEQLYLSHHTVGFHLRSIFTKLGASSRVELTRLAMGRPVDQSVAAAR